MTIYHPWYLVGAIVIWSLLMALWGGIAGYAIRAAEGKSEGQK